MRGIFFSLFVMAMAQPAIAKSHLPIVTPKAKTGSSSPFTLLGARAIWRNAQELFYTPANNIRFAELSFAALQLESGQQWPMALDHREGGAYVLRFQSAPSDIKQWLREPTVFVAFDSTGREIDRTYFQTAALLDSIYHYDGCLGVCIENGQITLRVWAPTARSVRLQWVSAGPNPQEISSDAMNLGPEGTFELTGDASWLDRNYLYQVEVFSAATGSVEKFSVTDPYSVGLSVNSASSVVLDLNDNRWMPSGWGSYPAPPLNFRTDSVIYEMHVRDFSSRDASVPDGYRGTYRAFAFSDTAGDQQLRALADAGITHVHLMPATDFTSVDEDPANRREPQYFSNLPTDSPIPQESITRFRGVDSYNWGYDPFHFLVPDGSYSTMAEGGVRTAEFREMVQALHYRGLRVVMDMVFNHTFAAGLANESVLDKVVPGYYYRLDSEGQIRNSSCCADTASERWMMEKLMRDSLETWRSQYGIDGFRFDLMNFHSVETMGRIRDFLRERDPSLLLYGEAWPFGSLYDSDPGAAFVQTRAYGQEIGVFNDRMRDAIRGGTTDSREKSDQGFVTGLFYDFNEESANRNTPLDLGAQRDKLLWLGDVVRVGLTGNLRDYVLTDHRGNRIQGGDLEFNGGPTGFAANPEDTINYVSAHDGYTLWDALSAKLPFHTRSRDPQTTSMPERMQRQLLALGLVAFGQGIPFFDEGSDLLRSKSGDQNSYDSGDWFNGVDWTGSTSGWGMGLPPSFSNPNDWPFWRPRLADASLIPSPEQIQYVHNEFLNMLRVRRSSPLFHLRSGEEVRARVHFLDSELGPMQQPGLIVMEIKDDGFFGENLDPNWKRLVVTVNATNDTIVFPHDSLGRAPLHLIYGHGEFRWNPPELVLPARSISVWGEQ